jgi:hypothetical protein
LSRAIFVSLGLGASVAVPDHAGDATPVVRATPEAAPDGISSDVAAVVKLSRPRRKHAPSEVRASAVVIEGKRTLTNAHALLFASQVRGGRIRRARKSQLRLLLLQPALTWPFSE